MSIIVQKYGGSSVADVAKLGLVADRVVAAKRAGHDVVVVVSAMGKTTDQLIALAKQVTEAAPPSAVGAEPARRELDMLVSTGERVSMALLSIAIHARGFDAISFTGSQSGILTNDRHFDARIIEVRPHRIQDELARGKIVIVAGYQGMSYKREITTLGRGGSDTTAVALAAALAAERCEIYSDVDGVYSADPRVVADAKHLPVMDLAMLAEMAESGAKVLNAQAVEWARRQKIAIHARRTSDPVGGGLETIARESDENRNVRAVVGQAGVVLARLPATRLGTFLDAAQAEEVALGDVVVADDVALAHVPLLNVPDWERCSASLQKACASGGDARGAGLELLGKHGVVSVVGYGLTGGSAALGRFVAALAKEGIATACTSASPLRISATIDEAKLADAQRVLHDALV
ncbi:MAG: aspartate kinase [Deltaproteobacteria bacterium]|nr:aspartate kinase [Deltaproteobacteria bacterium]